MDGVGNSTLHVVELRGNSRQRGLQHGRQLRDPIQAAVDFYRHFFREHLGMSAEGMARRASAFLEPTAQLNPLLMDEYEGIAEGSGQRLEDILALTARYEITFEQVALETAPICSWVPAVREMEARCWDRAGTGGPR